MPRVRHHFLVRLDLFEIFTFLDSQSASDAADRFAEALDKACADLALMPLKGSLKTWGIPGAENIRTWSIESFRNFLIVYRPIENGIQVLAVTHGSRDLPPLVTHRL